MTHQTALTEGEERAALWIWNRLPQMPDTVSTKDAIRALLYTAFRIKYGEALHPGAGALPLRRVLQALEPPKTQLLANVQAEILSHAALELDDRLTVEHEEVPYDPDQPVPRYEDLVEETRSKVMSVPPDTGIGPELAEEIANEEDGGDMLPYDIV